MGFIGATRRSELAAIKVANLEPAKHGMALRLAISKGDRDGKGVTVALPHGKTRLCPVRTLQRLAGRRRLVKAQCSGATAPSPPPKACPGRW